MHYEALPVRFTLKENFLLCGNEVLFIPVKKEKGKKDRIGKQVKVRTLPKSEVVSRQIAYIINRRI